MNVSRLFRRNSAGLGFALVELLVVVVILAVLAAIAIPVFLHQKRKAEVAAAQSSVGAFASLLGTGQSTDGSVEVTQSQMTLTDGAGGTTSLTVPAEKGLRVSVGSVQGTDLSGTNIGDAWCVSMTNPEGGVISQRAGETKPNLSGISCYTGGALNTSFANGGGNVPEAPTNLIATAGDASASLSWTEPVGDGGTPITNYVATAAPSGKTCTAVFPSTMCSISGLTNETGYVFSVVANNAMGTSGNSTPSNIAIPRASTSVPDAPTDILVDGNSGSVTVSWTAPVNDGNTPITSYQVTSTPGSKTCVATDAASCTVTGLTNGTSYTFTVKARNKVGFGADSVVSSAVTPSTVPSAPLNVLGEIGSGQITVSWEAPLSDGAGAITGYTVTSSPGNKTCSTTGASTCNVSGLTNGTSYTFTVYATNSRGSGVASIPSDPVTPAVAPNSPTGVTVVPGVKQLSVSWTAPTNDGGSRITGYTVTANPGGFACTTAGTTSCVISGLTDGSAYTVTVSAANAAGNSTGAAAAGGETSTYDYPGAPTGVSAASGVAVGSMDLSWTAPASSGGTTVTNYSVQYRLSTDTLWTPFTHSVSSATSITVTGLTAGQTYDFQIAAINAVGAGTYASKNSVVVTTTPDAPTGITVTPGVSLATVSWTAPGFNGGAAIDQYQVTASPGGATCTASSPAVTCNVTLSGVTGSYSFTVKSHNVKGWSPASGTSSSITPYNELTATGGGSCQQKNSYNGTGQTWNVCSFASGGGVYVTTGARPFKVLLVAGGGVGGTGTPNGSGGGGGGGGVYETSALTLPTGATSIVVGAGGPVDNGDYYPCGGNYGGNSSISTLSVGGGGTGGTGKWNNKKPAGGGCGGVAGNNATGASGGGGSNDCGWSAAGSGSTSSTITGTSVAYGVGGGAASCSTAGATNANPGAGGGGVNPSGGPSSQAGRAGTVIVAYQIG